MEKLPDHFMVDQAGDLFDTRDPQWYERDPIRRGYAWHHSRINTVAQLKACLRAGEYAWPGGYLCFFVTSDGGVLTFDAVRAEFRSVLWSIKNGVNDGWRVAGMDCIANYDDDHLIVCDHTGVVLNGDPDHG